MHIVVQLLVFVMLIRLLQLGATGKFGLGIRNEAGQRLIVLPRKCTGHSKHPLPTQEKTLHMDITKIRLIIFFAAKDGEAIYSQQKQDRELTVAQIIFTLSPNNSALRDLFKSCKSTA